MEHTTRTRTRRRRMMGATAALAVTALTGIAAPNAGAARPATPPPCTPVLADDAYTTPMDTALTVPDPGVFANDPELCTGGLSVTRTAASHGDYSFGNGGFTYTPDQGFVGTDSWTYQVNATSNVATVTITVEAPPAPPPCTPQAVDDAYTMPAGSPFTVADPGVLGNDTACGGVPELVPEDDDVTFNAGGGFTYDPGTNHGILSFPYVIRMPDGSASNEARVTMRVEPAPGCITDASHDSYTAVSGQPLTVAAPGVLANDAETCGGALQLYLPTSHGTVALAADGSFTYTSDAGYVGSDLFVYVIWFEATQVGVSREVTIDVQGSGPRPTCIPAVADDTFTVESGGVLDVPAPGVAANDTPCGKSVNLVDQPAHGTATLGFDGSLRYTPDAGFVGTDSFTYGHITVAVPAFRRAVAAPGEGPGTATVTINVSAPAATTEPPATTDPATTDPATTAATTPSTSVASTGGTLPATGGSHLLIIATATAAIMIGSIFLVAFRRLGR